jgi:putative oxidoreductase
MNILRLCEAQAHWSLRVAVAGVFIYHGWDKFPKLEMMGQMLGLPVWLILLVALTEVGGGALVFVSGFLPDSLRDLGTRIGSLALVPVLLGAIGMYHWGQWSFVASATHPMGGMEFQVTLLLVLLYLIVRGRKA